MDPSINSSSHWKLPHLIENIENASGEFFIPFIAVTESWTKAHITDAQIQIPHYTIFRADRIGRDRGGALMYVHDDIPTSIEASYDDQQCQAVFCTLPSSNTILASVYRPPDTTVEDTNKLLKFMNDYIRQATRDHHMDIIITGDFNLKGICWKDLTINKDESSKSAEALLSFMAENLLSQYVDTPTRKNNILDLFITNNPNLPLHVTTEDTNMSDHRIISVITQQTLKPIPPKAKPTFPAHTFRNLKIEKSIIPDIKKHLKEVNWDELKSICTEQEFPELFRLTVLQISEIYASLKSDKRQSSKPLNKFVRERTILNRKRRRLNARLQAAKSVEHNKHNIDKIEKEFNGVISKIKESHQNEKLEDERKAIDTIKENPKYFYSYSKKHSKKKSTVGPLIDENNQLQQDPKKIADMLQDQYSSVFSDPDTNTDHHPKPENLISILDDIDFTCDDITAAIKEMGEFSAGRNDDIPSVILKNCAEELSYPILLIWKDSMNSSYISPSFKAQNITPVFKKGSKAAPENYRPISLTSHIIKIFGRVVRKKMVAHLTANEILCKNQHAFQKGRSCLTQLLAHLDIIIRNALEGNDTDSIYLDFSKAFDKVDHKILLQKLYACGIRGKLLNWLKSYLSNRIQTVVVNGKSSYLAEVKSGVPQGTVLGPILFLIYINDLSKCIKHSLISHFADDTRILKAITCSHDVTLLQEDLHETITWSSNNKMVLHEGKFELLCHTTGKPKLFHELPFTSQYFEYTTKDGTVITPCSIVKDLGVFVSSNLSWTPHINILADNGRKLIAWILSVFSDRSELTMMTLYNSIIRSRLEYLSPLWNPSKIEDIKTIEGVQRYFTSKITGLDNYTYWERLQKLNLLSLQRRRERFIIIMMWKILNNVCPNSLNIQKTISDRRGLKAVVPPLTKSASAHSQSVYDSSFGVMGPRLWNCLPAKLTNITSKTTFKTHLSRYLVRFPDHPPVDGISSENSLLEMNRSKMMGGQAAAMSGCSDGLCR